MDSLLILQSDDFLRPKLFKLNKMDWIENESLKKDILCHAHIFHTMHSKNEELDYLNVMKLLEKNNQLISTDYAFNQVVKKHFQ